MVNNKEIGKRINTRREQLELTLKQVADKVGVAPSTIMRYESGSFDRIKLPVLLKIAEALYVNPEWITGASDDMGGGNQLPDNIIPMPKMGRIPLVGTIACGVPILAEQNVEEYIDLPEHVHADFALRCKGDSMKGARILDGDVVYIRQQPTVNNGEIAAVLIDNEATLKRVYISENSIILQPENPEYSPLAFAGEQMENVHIIGKAMAFTSIVK